MNSRYPDSQFLRICFAQFLIDFTDLNNIIRYQIELLDQYSLDIETRIKKFRAYQDLNQIDKEITQRSSKTRSSHTNDPSSAISSTAGFFSETMIIKLNSLMTDLLENSTTYYMYMWQNLLDDSPKIDKVRDSLYKSYDRITQVEMFYQRNTVFASLNLEGKKNYALYMREILKRERDADRLLQNFYLRMKRVVRSKNDLVGVSLDTDLGEYNSPILILVKDGVR